MNIFPKHILFFITLVSFSCTPLSSTIETPPDGRYQYSDTRKVTVGPVTGWDPRTGWFEMTTSGNTVTLDGTFSTTGIFVGKKNIHLEPAMVAKMDGTELIYTFETMEKGSHYKQYIIKYSIEGTVLDKNGRFVPYKGKGTMDARRM